MKKIVFLFLLLSSGLVFAQIPQGYYTSAEGKADAALKTALFNIVGSHTALTYADLWTAFQTTDKRADGKVWDIYSNTTNYTFITNQCGNYVNEGDCYNREHSFPKSWFNDATPMYTDLFHLYPSDGKVNGMRSNFPFGEVGAITYSSNNGYSKLGTCSFPGYTGTVFEPANELKGDLARTYFYMVTAYENLIQGWSSEHLDGLKYPGLNAWSVALLLKWHRQDPVSQKEINRNNVIYRDFQHNRNPFIDHPELAEYIWGTEKGKPWAESVITSPYLESPIAGSTADFGKVPFQQNSTITIDVKGANLTGNLSLALSGTNSSYFSIPVTTITQSEAETGYKLNITYNAAVLGKHTATLTITGGGINPVNLNLTAESTDSFIALAATNITENSFTANWSNSANATGYLLNVYSYSNNGVAPVTLLAEGFKSGLPSSWIGTPYWDSSSLTGNIRLASSNNSGSITTPTLDLSSSTVLTVRAKQYSNDTGAKLYIKVDNDSITALTTAVTNSDFEVMLPSATSTSKVTFLALKSSRVYVDSVKVATEGVTLTTVPVLGFPQQVGNFLSYHVSGLQADQTYYYTVTPQGNGTQISDIITVRTLAASSSKKDTPMFPITWYVAEKTLWLKNLPEECRIILYDAMGRQIKNIQTTSPEVNIQLPFKGIYLLQVHKDQKTQGYKILY